MSHDTRLLKGYIGDDKMSVTAWLKRLVAGAVINLLQHKLNATLAHRLGGNNGTGRTIINHHLLALATQRHHLHNAFGEQPERLLNIEQRRILQREAVAHTLDIGHQRKHIRRAVLQAEDPLALVGAAVGVGVNPVEMVGRGGKEILRRGGHNLHIPDAHTAQILACNISQHLVTLQRNDAPEICRQSSRIHTQSAGQIEQALALDSLCRSTLLARRLLEGTGRNDAARLIQAGQLTPCTLEILHLRGHLAGIGHTLVEGYTQRVTLEVLAYGSGNFGQKQYVEFGAGHRITS